MDARSSSVRGYRFGSFELDLHAGELRKNGLKVKLQDQPFTMLQLLLERQGALVTREEVQKRLWPQDTFVDFEKGLNTAAFNLRTALGDDAENPLFVQTVPKKGYRFIAPVEELRDTAVTAPAPEIVAPSIPRASPGWALLLKLAAFAAAVALAWWFIPKPQPSRIMVAVLLCDNLTGDKGQEYLSRGLTEELINQLSRVNPETLGVPGFATASSLATIDPVKAGQRLNVQYVVACSVFRVGDRIRIAARLVQTKDGAAVWTNGNGSESDVKDILPARLKPRPRKSRRESRSSCCPRPSRQP